MKKVYIVHTSDYHYFKQFNTENEVEHFIEEYVFINEEHLEHGGIIINEYTDDTLTYTETIDMYMCEEMNRF